jgi:hypothetical protein
LIKVPPVRWLDTEVNYLGDPEPGETGAQFGAGISDRQPPVDGDRHTFVPSPELPLKGAARRGIDGLDALVSIARQIFRPTRSAVTRDVGGRSDRKDTCVEKAAGNQRRRCRLAEADRQVEAVADKVPDPVPSFDAKLQPRVPQEEVA